MAPAPGPLCGKSLQTFMSIFLNFGKMSDICKVFHVQPRYLFYYFYLYLGQSTFISYSVNTSPAPTAQRNDMFHSNLLPFSLSAFSYLVQHRASGLSPDYDFYEIFQCPRNYNHLFLLHDCWIKGTIRSLHLRNHISRTLQITSHVAPSESTERAWLPACWLTGGRFKPGWNDLSEEGRLLTGSLSTEG